MNLSLAAVLLAALAQVAEAPAGVESLLEANEPRTTPCLDQVSEREEVRVTVTEGVARFEGDGPAGKCLSSLELRAPGTVEGGTLVLKRDAKLIAVLIGTHGESTGDSDLWDFGEALETAEGVTVASSREPTPAPVEVTVTADVSYDPELVESVPTHRRYLGQLKYCFEEVGDGASQVIQTTAIIQDERVSGIDIHASSDLASCVGRKMKRWRFPAGPKRVMEARWTFEVEGEPAE